MVQSNTSPKPSLWTVMQLCKPATLFKGTILQSIHDTCFILKSHPNEPDPCLFVFFVFKGHFHRIILLSKIPNAVQYTSLQGCFHRRILLSKIPDAVQHTSLAVQYTSLQGYFHRSILLSKIPDAVQHASLIFLDEKS